MRAGLASSCRGCRWSPPHIAARRLRPVAGLLQDRRRHLSRRHLQRSQQPAECAVRDRGRRRPRRRRSPGCRSACRRGPRGTGITHHIGADHLDPAGVDAGRARRASGRKGVRLRVRQGRLAGSADTWLHLSSCSRRRCGCTAWRWSAQGCWAHHRFLAAAAAPLLSSVVVIIAYLSYAALAAPSANDNPIELTGQALAALGWGTTLGVFALAVCTLVPLGAVGLRLRPRLRFAEGDRSVIITIAAAGIAGLILQQLSVLLINWSAQQTGDQGALTRFTWANAIYLLPYAVLAAPLLQLSFPWLADARRRADPTSARCFLNRPGHGSDGLAGCCPAGGDRCPGGAVLCSAQAPGVWTRWPGRLLRSRRRLSGSPCLACPRVLCSPNIWVRRRGSQRERLGRSDHLRGRAAPGCSRCVAGPGPGGQCLPGNGPGRGCGVAATAAVWDARCWVGTTDVGRPGGRRAGGWRRRSRLAAAG